MIYLGYGTAEKQRIVAEYQAAHAIHKTVVIAPERFPLLMPGADQVGYADVIMYVTFYRLLQEIDGETLIVLNECLRTQNRYDLAYNCIRNYQNQTTHSLVFQTLPQIDEQEDFMILFDFATQSRWKRRHFEAELIRDNTQVCVKPWALDFQRIDVPTSAGTQWRYAEERARRFAELGAADPHTLPRNLYLIGGKDKLAWMDGGGREWTGVDKHGRTGTGGIRVGQLGIFDEGTGQSGGLRHYVGRNKRLGHEHVVTYDDVQPGPSTTLCSAQDAGPYTVVEFPHRFIDWCDFVSYTGQAASDVLVADLKVDHWYWDRYVAWKERIHATYASLRG